MGSAESFVLQGISKECFPGCENKGRKNCVFLPAEGKQNTNFSPDFTQPGKRSVEIPCTLRSLTESDTDIYIIVLRHSSLHSHFRAKFGHEKVVLGT